MKWALLLLMMVGCKEGSIFQNFEAGDCVDRADWVTEDRKLNGNSYTKIRGRSVRGTHFLVERCLIRESGAQECSLEEPVSVEDMVNNYERIECPEVKEKK